MATEAQIKCANAGMSLIRDHESYKAEFSSPTIFPATNLKGLITDEDLKVPWSELAMHTKVAGKEVLAFALVGSATAIVITDDGVGGCEYHHGLQEEILSKALIDKTNEMFKRKSGNPHNPRILTVPEQHQLKIAKDTLKMPDAMAGVMGGPTKEQAREVIKKLEGRGGEG